MIKYLKSIWDKIKSYPIWKKILLVFLTIIYIGVLCICLITIKVDSTTPGTVTRVNNVVHINSDNTQGSIYTVSVFTENKVSLLEYFLRKNNDFIDINIGESTTYQIYTENEDYLSNVGYKSQSIQDSIILAYNTAKSKGIDVTLDYRYKGEYLIHIPSNLYKTSSTDFKNGDIVTKFDGKVVSSELDLLNYLKEDLNNVLYEGKSITSLYDEKRFDLYDENNKKIEENITLTMDVIESIYKDNSDKKFTVLRNGTEVEVTPSRRMEFYLLTHKILKKEDTNKLLYTIKDCSFSYFDIDYEKANPSIDISKTSSVGPSGGLMQTLAVYNAITSTDITKGLRIMGTGGITRDGAVTTIGGEQQKVVTANLYLANVFFVPSDNYESAKTMYDKLKEPKMQIIGVKTFQDALYYLERME